MKKIIFPAAMLLLLVFISCNSKKEAPKDDLKIALLPASTTDNSPNSELNEPPLIDNDQQQVSSDTITAKPIPVLPAGTIDWDKKIIKTASLKLEVPDFKKYNETVYKTVKQLGGYVAQENQHLSPEKNETVISIKVPVYQFETMMNELPGADTKVLERTIATDDVTTKIVDTKSRLEAKKEMRQKYIEFLKQSKNMKEVLQVQSEINEIQEEIESASGQVNYMSHQSAMSTINLTFFQVIADYKPEPITGQPSFLTRLSKSFKSGAAWLSDLLIGLASIWPLILIIFALAILWKRSRTKLVPGTVSKK